VIGRRACLAGLAAAPTWPAAAQATQKIGVLSVSEHPFINDFCDRLRELGFVEGSNLVIEYRYAKGNAVLLPDLVEDLLKAGVGVIVPSGSGATDAAVTYGKSVPIVFLSSDPTGSAQISSLARPGGNATGISTMSQDIAPKKVGLLREAVPKLARLALLNDGSLGGGRQCESMNAAARQVGVEGKTISMPAPAEFGRAFAEIASGECQAVAAVSSPMFSTSAREVADLTKQHRLPALFDIPAFVQAGALMAYGPDLKAAFRRQAELVQRVLRGGRVANMPVEQPTKFLFAFNQATARAMGVSLSFATMASIDELVE
jgi:putative tryptophan/tyrosine transport system substrate-binding protein